MTEIASRSDSNTCFICGPDNPDGLQVEFRMDGDLCKAEYTPPAKHCGYEGVTHGGIIFSLLDDVMANWLYLLANRMPCNTCLCLQNMQMVQSPKRIFYQSVSYLLPVNTSSGNLKPIGVLIQVVGL